MLIVSTGCPSSIGPEISVRAAAALRGIPCILVGDRDTLSEAAELVGVERKRLKPFPQTFEPTQARGVYVYSTGPALRPSLRKPGRPSSLAGRAQLAYVEEAASLCRRLGGALVTAAVSKAAIAKSGDPRLKHFLGHTEWLQHMAKSPRVTMCFWTPKFCTSLVTTHLPISAVPRALSTDKVRTAILHLCELLEAVGVRRPKIAVCSLNPHAGEAGLLGGEEATAIAPGIALAKKALRGRLSSIVLLGAETAYRRAASGHFDGVVAMYHDQATIPTKLVSFGTAVNVTMGLGYPRTSVDHGTAYDIAWRGIADPSGMRSALKLAARMCD